MVELQVRQLHIFAGELWEEVEGTAKGLNADVDDDDQSHGPMPRLEVRLVVNCLVDEDYGKSNQGTGYCSNHGNPVIADFALAVNLWNEAAFRRKEEKGFRHQQGKSNRHQYWMPREQT